MLKPKKPKRYLRRSERIGDRVITHYLGRLSDPINLILFESEKLTDAIKCANRDAAEEELAHQERLEICQNYLATKINRMVWRYQYRLANGYDAPYTNVEDQLMEHQHSQENDTVSVSQDDWDDNVADAADGDEAALEELKRILRFNPAICEKLGDLSRHVQTTMIDILGAESIATREAFQIELEKLRSGLHQKDSHPLERLLVEQVITTKLDLAIQQIGCAQPQPKETLKRRWERRMDRAQKRHLAAITAWVEFRELAYGEG